MVQKFDVLGAEAMLHLFRVDRPGQVHRIPEITPTLPLFAQLQRFTLAVIGSTNNHESKIAEQFLLW